MKTQILLYDPILKGKLVGGHWIKRQQQIHCEGAAIQIELTPKERLKNTFITYPHHVVHQNYRGTV